MYIYIYTYMYIAAQWYNTYNMGYVARRKLLGLFCTPQLLCVITCSTSKSLIPLPLTKSVQ